MSLGLIVIVVLVVLLLGSAGDYYYYGNSFPHALGGGLGLVFTLLLIFWVLGAFSSMR